MTVVDILFKIAGVGFSLLLLLQIPLELRRKPAAMTRLEFDRSESVAIQASATAVRSEIRVEEVGEPHCLSQEAI